MHTCSYIMYVALRWEAIILLCENLQYGDYDYDDAVYGDDVR